jgi:hypothetical protein
VFGVQNESVAPGIAIQIRLKMLEKVYVFVLMLYTNDCACFEIALLAVSNSLCTDLRLLGRQQ